ncbi:hypothetical protein M409DRAFT_22380 [Zasmidium cellare ATCC 36951]|uniref:Cytochrome b561 domain-containing protein n=1 Tax=Zasmidium cellare ATCC 36951 TaxID=1080233 RepID=A0A6A6CQ33_ZASCE|nr:uncharacterized protein M409DRAFT_22380 [Zasmidium cellare ATCC 36951]KAF2167576.1 hypothetical protein M409DRAFT_22380 [Zasmidium cellare ATCC 36951]
MDIWLVHGLLGCVAFFLVWPLGIVKLWAKKSRWPIQHWAIQSTGLLILMSTAALGLLNSGSLHHPHQVLGLGVSSMALFQMILGHANSLKSRKTTTYINLAHAILGFSTILLGWLTILAGFCLASLDSTSFIVIGLLSAIEVLALVAGSVVIRWRAQSTSQLDGVGKEADGSDSRLYTLAEDENDDEQDGAAYKDETTPTQQSAGTMHEKSPV